MLENFTKIRNKFKIFDFLKKQMKVIHFTLQPKILYSLWNIGEWCTVS